ncbi:pilus assembly protein [Pedococcus sp. 5OH_020]|uniref:pilus assembly protein n=1 Tax=Pedococcus sp. 5OH_020 TaxID=2989814 RepID=UPI0022EA061E|nr:pilus assembly protein [Pedococcus sp. 5OH_020]
MEFVFLGVLLLVPLIYLVMTLARAQAGAYAVSTAAREAGRAFVTASTESGARQRAGVAARLAFEDQGFGGRGTLSLSCDGAPCLRPNGRVQLTTTVTVPLPLVPKFARGVVPLELPLRATHVAVVDRFRAEP